VDLLIDWFTPIVGRRLKGADIYSLCQGEWLSYLGPWRVGDVAKGINSIVSSG